MAGNSNSGRRKSERQFADALQLAIRNNDGEDLRAVVTSLISKAKAGDIQAIREFADRLDGKVPLQVAGDPDNPVNVITEIRWKLPATDGN